MSINTKVKYTLLSESRKIVIAYNTYEKAPYDMYLAASILKASNGDENRYIKYIDDITGNGSLNSHFRNLCEEILEKGEETISTILNSNLIPIMVYDESQKFDYFPAIDVSQLNGKYYKGNLGEDENILKKLVHVDDREDHKLLSIETKGLKEDKVQVLFDTIFQEDYFDIIINQNGEKIRCKYDVFAELYPQYPALSSDILHVYKGTIHSLGKGMDKWALLTTNIINEYAKQNITFYINGDLDMAILNQNSIDLVQVCEHRSIYFYNVDSYEFNVKNMEICNATLNYLLEKPSLLNEYKVKDLLPLLEVCSSDNAQRCACYLLGKKNSPELAKFSLKLVKEGYTNYLWEESAFKQMLGVAYVDSDQFGMTSLYKMYVGHEYTINELILVNTDTLRPEDNEKLDKYYADRESKITQLNYWIGEITNSGVRESMKHLPKEDKDNAWSTLKKYLDKHQGHPDDLHAYNDSKLDEFYSETDKIIRNEFRIIRDRVDKRGIGK